MGWRRAWRLFGRVLRTLGGKNIGKCRLRAQQHPLLPPLPNLRRARPLANIQGKTCAWVRDGTRAGGCAGGASWGMCSGSMLKMGCFLQRFLISGGQFGNHCRVLPVYTLLRAVILDFRARLGNRCKLFPVYALFRASILDFRLKLENRCWVFPVYALLRASILDFRARLENRCKVFPV